MQGKAAGNSPEGDGSLPARSCPETRVRGWRCGEKEDKKKGLNKYINAFIYA